MVLSMYGRCPKGNDDMKVLKGHLTQLEKKAITAIIMQGFINKPAKVGRKVYHVTKLETHFTVAISENQSNDFGKMVLRTKKYEFII
jgi:hypothetical protein